MSTAYEGEFITVTVVDGVEIVEHPGSVAVVAVDDQGFVTLVRQHREPARESLLELPAGTLEDGEAPLAAAKRELEEEVGLTGGTWREAATFFTTPGFCRERMHLFVAEGCERGEPRPAADESLEIVRISRDNVEATLAEIEDAKTLVGLLLYLREQG
jgi:ADP-ribose pyrophosphatase